MTKYVPAFHLHWKFLACAFDFAETALQVWVHQGNFKAGTESTPKIQNVCQLFQFSLEKFNLNHTQKWRKGHLIEVHLVTKQRVKLFTDDMTDYSCLPVGYVVLLIGCHQGHHRLIAIKTCFNEVHYQHLQNLTSLARLRTVKRGKSLPIF